MRLTLPYPPAANNLYYTHGGRRHLSKRGREYHTDVTMSVLEQKQGAFVGTARLSYALCVYPPDRRRRDLSNVLKILEDALTKAGVWADDSQVDRISVARMAPCKGGRAEIFIEELA